MKPVKRTERTAFLNGPKVGVVDVNADLMSDLDFNEEGDMSFLDDLTVQANSNIKENKKTSELLRIAALNQAINMAKLMSNVTVEDIIVIAEQVETYITSPVK